MRKRPAHINQAHYITVGNKNQEQIKKWLNLSTIVVFIRFIVACFEFSAYL
jgi:hypothetical protein